MNHVEEPKPNFGDVWLSLIFFGTMVTLLCGYFFVKEMRFSHVAKPIIATVSDNWSVGKGGMVHTRGYYTFVVKGHLFDGSFEGSRSNGDSIPILYDPANPKHNRLPGIDYQLPFGIGLVVGLVLLIAGIASLLHDEYLWKPDPPETS